MKTRLCTAIVVLGLGMVGCVAERTPPPIMPTFQTGQGKTNARQCQLAHNQCSTSCWSFGVGWAGMAAAQSKSNLCKNDCDRLLSDCYRLCE
jgi:hypothetical protein